jgi:hypothetical protein
MSAMAGAAAMNRAGESSSHSASRVEMENRSTTVDPTRGELSHRTTHSTVTRPMAFGPTPTPDRLKTAEAGVSLRV